MAQTYTINGVAYTFPDVDDSDWGQNVTDWAGAVSSFLLQRSGGTFTLSAEVDFGSSYGLLVKDLGSKTANPASAGFLQLAKTDVIAWRNNANSGDINLEKGTDDLLQFNSIDLVDLSTAQTLTNKTMTSPVIDTGISGTAIDNNTSLGSSATKVPTQNAVKSYVDAQLTASDLDFSGDSGGAQSVDLDSQSLTVEGGTGVDTTGSAQKISIAIDSSVTTNSGSQTLTNKTLTTPIIGSISNTGTLTLPTSTDTLVGRATTDTLTNKTLTSPKINEDVVMTTTSTYLNRMDATSNVQAQIDSKQATITGAATTIASSDLTASKVLQSNGSGKVEASTVTTTTLGYLDATSSVQTQLDAKAPLASPYFTTYADFDSQGSAPAAPSNTGDVRLYAKDSKLYFHPQGGSATEVGSGGGAGDADTIQLKAANDFDAVNTAPWYTGNDLVPGGGGTIGGTWELSTSNPLINTNDATKVFHYSNGTSNRKGDYFEIELDVPNYAKGHNLVVQLFYRTVGAEDTDFLFFARDRTADYSTQANGAQGATNNVVVDSSTGFAVGDRICFEDSSNARHFRYVTAVPDSTHVTFSGAAAAFADDAAIVTKFFTDELNFITAENNTTNYEGKIRKWAFKINDTTTKIRVGFLYDNSATSTNELFFDQILLSSNQFLQTSSQGQSEYYHHEQWNSGTASTNSYRPYLQGAADQDTISELGTVTNSSSLGWHFQAKQKVKVALTVVLCNSGTNGYWGVLKKTDLGTNVGFGHDAENDGKRVFSSYATASEQQTCCAQVIMEPNEYLYIVKNDTNTLETEDEKGMITMTATPLVNDVVLLNSQDEIFTDWQDYGSSVGDVFYTTSWAAGGANTVEKAVWRRIGSEMELKIDFVVAGSGTVSSDYGILRIPSGYTIDKTKIGGGQKTILGTYYKTYSNSDFNTTSMSGVVTTRDDYEQYLYLSYQSKSDHTIELNSINAFANHNERFMVNVKIPIQGWTSTFNPVLSMPLVDMGHPVECYVAKLQNEFWDASSGHQYLWEKSLLVPKGGTPALASSNLITISDITSGSNTVTAITAKQDITLSVTMVGRCLAGGFVAIYNSSDELVIINTTSTAHYETDVSQTLTLSGGDYIYFYLQDSSNSYGRYGALSIMAERKLSGNTAHIIKPAVCVFSHVLPYNSDGGGTATGWDTREINTVEGESWFCSVNQSTDVITVDPGMYRIKAWQTISRSGAVASRIYSTTNSNTLIKGTTATVPDANYISLVAEGVKTFSAAHSFRWEYEAYEASGGGDAARGLGMAASHSGSSESWVASYVIVEKLK